MTMTAAPARPVTQAEIDAYKRDGAVVLRGIMPMEWVDLAREAVEEVHAERSNAEFFGDGNRSFLANMNGPRNDKVRRYLMESPVASIAGTVHGASSLHYFLDQIFYKAAGPVVRTDWHQDTPYLSITGRDVVRAWLPCDPAPRRIALQFVSGSHRWGVTYGTAPLPKDEETVKPADGGYSVAELQSDSSAPPLPDINANPEAYEIVGWDVELGDLVVFDGHILHGAGDTPDHPMDRRALAIMFAGPQESFVKRPGHSIPDSGVVSKAELKTGDILSEHPEAYPVVWRA